MKNIIILSITLVIFDAFDSITTWIGFKHGLGESNPIANAILNASPFAFWIGGTILYSILAYLIYQVAKQHPRLRVYTFVFLGLLVINKSVPIIWNTIQILIVRGVIT
jgi:hypothetical protein